MRSRTSPQPFGIAGADASWCRWVLSFVTNPAATVHHIAAALKPGGTAIFHEYVAYETWRMMPPDPLHERFRGQVEKSWRDSGGEPDIALWLPQWLGEAGFESSKRAVLADIITPADEKWEWPHSFMATGSQRTARARLCRGGRSRGHVANCSTTRRLARTC